MAAPLLRKRSLVAAKFESSAGSMASIGATDAKFLVSDVTYKAESTLIPRNMVGPSFARKRSLPSTKLARITFKSEVVGSGTAGTEPAWATLIKACGFNVTTVASTSNTYDPVTNPATYDATGANGNVTVTIWVYEDGKVKKARGCRGTFKVTGESSGLCHIEWDFLGIHDSVADAAYPTLHVSYDSSQPPLLESATFNFHSVGSGVLLIRSFTIDAGNVVAPRFDASSASGIKEIFINDREVVGSIDPEEMLNATFEPITRMNTPLVGGFDLTIGSTAGNRMVISAPAAECQVMDTAEGDRDQAIISNLSLAFHMPMVEGASPEIRFALT